MFNTKEDMKGRENREIKGVKCKKVERRQVVRRGIKPNILIILNII